LYEVNGLGNPLFKFKVWLNENNYEICKPLPFSDQKMLQEMGSNIGTFHRLEVVREGNKISLEINGEKRTYYLKTPPIWKLK
jgi:hypothetical protein